MTVGGERARSAVASVAVAVDRQRRVDGRHLIGKQRRNQDQGDKLPCDFPGGWLSEARGAGFAGTRAPNWDWLEGLTVGKYSRDGSEAWEGGRETSMSERSSRHYYIHASNIKHS